MRGEEALCNWCAVSLFDTRKNAEAFLRAYILQKPDFRYRVLGEMDLTKGGHGVIHRADRKRKGHHNWWLYEGTAAKFYFTRRTWKVNV